MVKVTLSPPSTRLDSMLFAVQSTHNGQQTELFGYWLKCLQESGQTNRSGTKVWCTNSGAFVDLIKLQSEQINGDADTSHVTDELLALHFHNIRKNEAFQCFTFSRTQ